MGYSRTLFVGNYAHLKLPQDRGNMHFVVNEEDGSPEDIEFTTKGRVTFDEARRIQAANMHAIFPEFLPRKKGVHEAFVMLPGYTRMDADADSTVQPIEPCLINNLAELTALLKKLYGADSVDVRYGAILEVW